MTPAGSGHTTYVQVCSADETYDDLSNSGDHFNFMCQRCSFYALPFANDSTDDHFSDSPEIITLSNLDDDGRSLTSNPTNLTGFFFKEKACILYILTPGAYCPNWTN